MKKKNAQLKPIEVGEIRPLPTNDGKKLTGFLLSVTYDGVVRSNQNSLLKMGLLSGGCGSTWRTIDVVNKKTIVNYFFRQGILFPEPLGRAEKFRDALQSAITDFCPVNIPRIRAQYKRDLFQYSCVCGYTVTVSYPKSAQNNPLFRKFATNNMPRVCEIKSNSDYVNVVYQFRKKTQDPDVSFAYERAIKFKTFMLARMKNENIK